MRLICPNCDAQYEVDDSVIPAEGRDVQCSNCATTWFQAAPGGEVTQPEAATPPEEPQFDEPVGNDAIDQGSNDEAALAAAAAAIAGSATASPAKPSSKMDPDALNVIHEEVDREAKARELEQGGLETQTDLGLDEGDSEARASAARDRMARRRGIQAQPEIEELAENDEVDAPDTSDPGAKSELLPDIEEINSTLADAPDPVLEDATTPVDTAASTASARRGFRIGFGLVLLIFALLIGLYAFGDEIAESVPALAAPLEQFREAVDGARVWLDGAAQSLVEQINALTGQISDS